MSSISRNDLKFKIPVDFQEVVDTLKTSYRIKFTKSNHRKHIATESKTYGEKVNIVRIQIYRGSVAMVTMSCGTCCRISWQLATIASLKSHSIFTHFFCMQLVYELHNTQTVRITDLTTGQSNLTKSASRGARSPVRGHPRGSKVAPLNSWGRVSYQCSIVTIGLGCTIWPQCTRLTTNDQRRHDTAYLNKRLFY